MSPAPPDPHLFTDVLVGLVGGGAVSLVIGCFLVVQALRNLREGSVPLTATVRLTGFVGRCGAVALLAAGTIFALTGGVLACLALWRLAIWLTGG